MINVLVNAYAINPKWGSEPGMGWNWVINLAKYAKLHVITEGEWRAEIEEALELLPQKDNITFYYNPIGERVQRMCANQGDWRFYYYYRKWQKQTYKMACEIMVTEQIDIVHQLNMIGFREPGYLWKITGKPFTWGPFGGLGDFPFAYLSGAGIKMNLQLRLKSFITNIQMNYAPRIVKAFRRADALISAVESAQKKIQKVYHKNVITINETGCYISNSDNDLSRFDNKEQFDILWVGRFLFTKQLGLALRSIANIKEINGLKFHIIGSGSKSQIAQYKKLSQELGLADVCVWHGAIPNTEVHKLMSRSHLFFFSSIVEGTPHVALEAVSNNLPVLCFNCCGQGAVVNEDIGLKIELSNPKRSVDEFSEKLEYLYNNRELLKKMSQSCANRQKELSWDSKAQQMVGIYKQVINR